MNLSSFRCWQKHYLAMYLFPMYLNWWRHTLSGSGNRTILETFLKTAFSSFTWRDESRMPYSTRVKKSINSAGEALFQYVNKASGGDRDSGVSFFYLFCLNIMTGQNEGEGDGRRSYPRTCSSAHVGSTWGGSWSLPARVCHIAAGSCPRSKQGGSAVWTHTNKHYPCRKWILTWRHLLHCGV